MHRGMSGKANFAKDIGLYHGVYSATMLMFNIVVYYVVSQFQLSSIAYYFITRQTASNCRNRMT